MSDYRASGRTLIRINPRKFRRGRAWQAGQQVRSERFKYWTLRTAVKP